ncbi:Uroporphyrinogen-III synthase [Rhodovulum sp. PH10]|uniref:uroporphyrinogen-III synthase n=1 Tax=Rhodovulum sp. PH10 TaxID=1187851 RepID=UPI00027C275C|nr:uroporphyrinogen-III synthase [Rhodovulum sp. PH10]EJW12662.1 Uroporphyrinogen-III synthase [Rhodovulum sp. PH10]
MRLLVTRPDPDAARTAALLRARGHEVVVAPLLRIATIPDAAIGDGPWAAIALTSAHAPSAIVSHPARAAFDGVPVFTVGAKTAAAAAAAGLTVARSADGDVAALAAVIAETLGARREPVLYPAGEERAGDLEGLLAGHGLSVRTVVVYRAVAETRLPAAVRAALADSTIDGVLHYSRRSAEAFLAALAVDGLAPARLSAAHYCLSLAVAAPLRAAAAGDVRVAPQPDQKSLFGLL